MTLQRVSQLDPQPPAIGSRPLSSLERLLVRVFDLPRRYLGDRDNPLLHLGALSNLALLVAVVTGILLLIWYVPSHDQAHASVEAMAASPLLAGLIRSLHRYSSDVAILMALLHGLQMFAQRRFAGPRWLAWVTGVGAVFFIWLIGWLGYWLVWDERAQALAVGTAKLLDVLPIFTDPLGRSFLTDETVSSLLFFVVFFVHMLLPLMMAIALWLHLARMARPRWLPARRMTWWALGTMVLLSIVLPATSADPASMTVQPTPDTIDAWYLLPLMLTDRLGGGALWLVFLGLSFAFFGLPWLLVRARKRPHEAPVPAPAGLVDAVHDDVNHASHSNHANPPNPSNPADPIDPIPSCDPAPPTTALAPPPPGQPFASLRRAPVSIVDPAKCNACETCYRDCPYDAIQMIPRSDGRNFPSVAWVDPDKCVGCGICAGSCDSSGVGPTWLTQPAERHRVDAWLATRDPAQPAPIILFACGRSATASLAYDPVTGHAPELARLVPGRAVLVVAVPCAGWVHPLTVERALRRGAAGVVVASCRAGTCAYREGADWTADRLAGRREPMLRTDHVDPTKVCHLAFDAHEPAAFGSALAAFAGSLAPAPSTSSTSTTQPTVAAASASPPRRRVPALALGVALAVLLGALTYLPAELPYAAPATRPPELVVSFKLAGETTETCRVLSADELAKLPPHKRIPKVCERSRAAVRLAVWVDGTLMSDEQHEPSGAFGDGASTAVSTLAIPAGEHEVEVALGTAADPRQREHRTSARRSFVEGRRHVLVFDKLGGFAWH